MTTGPKTANNSLSERLTMDQKRLHNLLGGTPKGPVSALLIHFLRLASWLYHVIVVMRNFCYSTGLLRAYSVTASGEVSSDKLQSAVPIISVGNITTGGTGKTPLVIWLCKRLQRKNLTCAILSRGYKTPKGKLSDEPAILARSCPDAKVIVAPDRIAGAVKATGSFGVRVLVMDDGFQHRRLARDLDIVTIDATLPFGYGRVLPAGLLREPLSTLKRADAAVVTRCDQIPPHKLDRIEEQLRRYNPNMIIARTIHAPLCAKAIGAKIITLEQLQSKNIFAFCGIGNPNGFIGTITKLGTNLVGSDVFDDHHQYTQKDIAGIFAQAALVNADLILTTEKDWNKTVLPASAGCDIDFAYLAVELKFISAKEQLTQLIESALAGKIPGS